MKISWKWFNKEYFDGKLPATPSDVIPLLKKFTMISFEVESVEEREGGDLLIDVKVTPNRAHDCLSLNGLAQEFALSNDLDFSWRKPWHDELGSITIGNTREFTVEIEEPKLCKRYVGRVIENIKVGDSPAWLKERLSSIGQRSINNVVDAANYVMWITGQPMHAFDADKVVNNKILIRRARGDEHITTLDNKEINLDESVLIIADSKDPLAVAGIKGGKRAEVDVNTKSLILESANFHSTNIRKTSRSIGVKTDASYRFEHDISPEIAEDAINMLSDLILSTAKTSETKIGQFIDIYAHKPKPYKVGASREETNSILGLVLNEVDIEKILNKLNKYSNLTWESVDPITRILEIAPSYVGIPYRYRTSITFDAPRLFDCSAFTAFLYSEVGIAIPRISIDQYFFGDEVMETELAPGDLIFAVGGAEDLAKIHRETIEFLPGTKFDKGINHVGLYMGDGNVIHANGRTNTVVVEEYVTSPSFKNICGFRRVVRDKNRRYVVTVPPRRLDLMSQYGFYKGGNKEDLIEEIGRVYGLAQIKSILPKTDSLKSVIDKSYYYQELVRATLCSLGFSELYNYTFVATGNPTQHLKLENPLSDGKTFMRHNLHDGLIERREFNQKNKDLLKTNFINVFEFGKVFTITGEELRFAITGERMGDVESALKNLFEKIGGPIPTPVEQGEQYFEFRFDEMISGLPNKSFYSDLLHTGSLTTVYKKFSAYPHVSRDIAIFVPSEITADMAFAVIRSESTELLVTHKLFDVFTKKFDDGTTKVSYAFRLVFQANNRTLTGEEVSSIMDKISNLLNSKDGWRVR